jgi:hypothetical protein
MLQQRLQVIKQEVDLRGSRVWNQSVVVYTKSTLVVRNDNCFAYMFTNLGDTIAYVNGMIIYPSTTPATALGDSRAISGHLLDLYKGDLNLVFKTPLGGAPAVEIVQLFYSETTVGR